MSSLYCTWSVYTSCSLTMLGWPSHCLKAAISLWVFASILTQITKPSNINKDVSETVKYSQAPKTKLLLRQCTSITTPLTYGSQSWLHTRGHFACVCISCTQRNYPLLGVVHEDTAHSAEKTVIPEQRRDDVSHNEWLKMWWTVFRFIRGYNMNFQSGESGLINISVLLILVTIYYYNFPFSHELWYIFLLLN